MTKSPLVLVLPVIGSESGLNYLDQSQSEVKRNKCNPGFLFHTQLKLLESFLQGHSPACHCDGLVEVVGLQGVMHLVSQNHHHLYPSHPNISRHMHHTVLSNLLRVFFSTNCHNFCILPFPFFLSICTGNVFI